MAEDGDAEQLFIEDPEEEVEEEFIKTHSPEQRERKCNERINELAMPGRRIFLDLWRNHAYHLPEEKVIYLKQLLQELYAMTPEETARYFAELRAEARAAAVRSKMKQKLRKLLNARKRRRKREKAYKTFGKLLRCGFNYCVNHKIPELISLRLRYLSDLVLERLCSIRNIDMPDREAPDEVGMFMISLADWIAVGIERMFYAVQLKTNEDSDVNMEDTDLHSDQILEDTFCTSTVESKLEFSPQFESTVRHP